MNNSIKTKIKKNMENQKLEKINYCKVCEKNTKHKLDFKIDMVACNVCKNSAPIGDEFYENIYKQFKAFGAKF